MFVNTRRLERFSLDTLRALTTATVNHVNAGPRYLDDNGNRGLAHGLDGHPTCRSIHGTLVKLNPILIPNYTVLKLHVPICRNRKGILVAARRISLGANR